MPPTGPDTAGRFVDDFGVDLSRPLLPQVAALADYDTWVHRPVHPRLLKELAALPDRRWPRSLRIFADDRLEALTHISWKLVLAIWLPVAVALLAGAARWQGLGAGRTAAWAAGGFVLWTLVEYALHRWVFHHVYTSPRGKQFHFLAHGIHHLDPADPTRLVFPPLSGAVIAGLIYLGLELLLPTGAAMAVMGGLLAGYLCYDMGHYYSHHGHPRDRFWRFMERYHKAHHYREPNALFGVSQPVWDLVWRTGSLKY